MMHKSYPRFGEDVYILNLKNGMRVHILPKEEPYYTTYVELSMPYGALDICFKHNHMTYQTQPGTAHFLEHKMFAMPNGEDAFQMFSKLGMDANAMTSYNQTSYLFTASDNLIDGLKHLLYMMDTPYFTEENVEQEKLIIYEELKMYFDDPNVVMQNDLMLQMYHHHPIKHDIGGDLDAVSAIKTSDLKTVYQSFYHPSNRLLVIAGKVDLKALKAFFKDYDDQIRVAYTKPKTIYPKEPKKLVKKHVVQFKDLQMNKLMLGIKLHPKKMTPQAQIKREMAMTMMLNMLLGASSTMYAQLLEQKLINQSFFIAPTFEKKAENIIIFGESKNVFKLKKILVDLLAKDGLALLSEDAFTRYKKVYLGQFIYALNSLEHKAYLYGKYIHMKTSLFESLDMLTEINYTDILEVYHEINPKTIASLIYKKTK